MQRPEKQDIYNRTTNQIVSYLKKGESLGLGRGTPNMRQDGLHAHFATMGTPTADFLAGNWSLRELIDRLEQVGVVVKVETTQFAGRNDEHNS